MKIKGIPLSSIPSRPGTYVLIMRLASAADIQVGKLGTFHCSAGWYAYVGSALGPGGLAARLTRHGQRDKRRHWHIDYLLAVAELIEAWWAVSPERQECAWARSLLRQPATTIPMPCFGASDCRCPAHLFYFAHRPSPFPLAAQPEGRWSLCCTPLADPA